jgi:hypothetical protein
LGFADCFIHTTLEALWAKLALVFLPDPAAGVFGGCRTNRVQTQGGSSMSKLWASIAGFITLLVLTPSVVLAKNYCIGNFPNPNFVYVGVGFHLPTKGHCSPFLGFVAGDGTNITATGVACASSDGSDVAFTLTSGSEVGEFVESDTIIFPLPAVHGTITGTYVGQLLQAGVASLNPETGGITGAACTTKTITAARAAVDSEQPRPSW